MLLSGEILTLVPKFSCMAGYIFIIPAATEADNRLAEIEGENIAERRPFFVIAGEKRVNSPKWLSHAAVSESETLHSKPSSNGEYHRRAGAPSSPMALAGAGGPQIHPSSPPSCLLAISLWSDILRAVYLVEEEALMAATRTLNDIKISRIDINRPLTYPIIFSGFIRVLYRGLTVGRHRAVQIAVLLSSCRTSSSLHFAHVAMY